MEFQRLGTSGLEVSRICLGTMTYGSSKWRDWVLEEDESRPFIQRSLELGINFFDTADVYSLGVSEEIVGRALKDFARRDDFAGHLIGDQKTFRSGNTIEKLSIRHLR